MSVWTSGDYGSISEVKSRNDLRRALEAGADPNELQPAHTNPAFHDSREARTPIEWYVGRQTWWKENIDMLVQHGADPNGGWKSLGKATTPKDESVWRGLRLLDLGADPRQALTQADPTVVEKLLQDEDFNQALTSAQKFQDLEALADIEDALLDPQDRLEALDQAQLLPALDKAGLLHAYHYDESWSWVEDLGPDDEEEASSIHEQAFTEYKPNVYYLDDEVMSLGQSDIARAMEATYHSAGVTNPTDFNDVLDGIRRHDAAEDRQEKLTTVATDVRGSDLASPEEAMARRLRGRSL